MLGTGRGRGEQLEAIWAWLKKRVTFNSRYMTPANRAGIIELAVQSRNFSLVNDTALQLYSMAKYSLVALDLGRREVQRLKSIVDRYDIEQVRTTMWLVCRCLYILSV